MEILQCVVELFDSAVLYLFAFRDKVEAGTKSDIIRMKTSIIYNCKCMCVGPDDGNARVHMLKCALFAK